jgi:predicted kinase
MIIPIRGPNGSGKSHLIRQLMAEYPRRAEHRITGVRHPVGYWLSDSASLGPLFVPGYYDPADHTIGGADTLRDSDELHELVYTAWTKGYSAAYETRNRHDGYARVTATFRPDLVHAVVIDHALSECLATVNSRGRRNSGRQLRVETIQAHWRKIIKEADEIGQRGYAVSMVTREAALTFVKSLLAT